MQLSKSFVFLALTAVSYASPPLPAASPVVLAELDVKLAAIHAQIQAQTGGDHTNSTSLDKRSVFCQTSGASPTTVDAIAASHYIQSLGGQSCCQENVVGSSCTTMYTYGSAAVGVCSVAPGTRYCGLCQDAGNGLLDISNSCSSQGLSGGWANYGNALTLILFHS
ncbi:hypothetical protein C8F01DRAFT_1080701 [Mycena amicta]|nr:hypothetical protein C8F01DRAFT_1080701 [Mycena amicta]